MGDEKMAVRLILCNLRKEELNVRAATKEIDDMEGSGTVNKRVAQNWFRRFKDGDTSLEDKPSSGRPSVVEDEILLEMFEQQLSTSTRTLSSVLGPSHSTVNLDTSIARSCEQTLSRSYS
ncbi:histone-lysine N-methyltransferase SETMAR-like [Octopus bimaculoides]|uniref:histone-lysine N-methyltransferase SETMAR-like n=1 Tax=Octopus bimaculoides TaxID=37653 RepID=UPI0022E492EC|nr:histone-lysine N-methyltransferase SETMAR-like [Octopus bimaculoides]